MDILTHTLSGIAAGTVAASFSNGNLRKKLIISASGGIGGFFPDLDVISLWSGFDKTLGRIFNLSHSGKEIFFGNFWYSHHGILHSVAGTLISALIFAFMFYILKNRFRKLSTDGLLLFLKSNILVLTAFITGAVIHSIEDMPTPGGPWGGVMFFFPLTKFYGGTGDIWWWNNYDIFLIVSATVFVNLSLLLISERTVMWFRKLIPVIFLAGAGLIIFQISSRSYNFNVKGTKNHEVVSKEIQKRILGDRLFNVMVNIDNKIRISF
jgi:hypothetical protein